MLLFTPLFVFLNFPGILPSQLGFKGYKLVEGTTTTYKVTWDEFYKLLGFETAKVIANSFWKALTNNKLKSWAEGYSFTLDNFYYIGIEGFVYKPKKDTSLWGKAKSFLGIK
jgi:hypothetical protein